MGSFHRVLLWRLQTSFNGKIRLAKVVIISDRSLLTGASLLCLTCFLGVFANLIAPYDPMRTGLSPGLEPPSLKFLMGTDQLGRDIFSWVVHGARTAIIVGVLSTSISFIIALMVGLVSGYFGGVVDNILMRVVDLLLSIPQFILIVIIVILYGSRFSNIILIIGLLSWPTLARIVRAEVLSLREREFVLAAKSIGCNSLDILFNEILPNALPPIIPATALLMSNSILTEAALSFLGLGDPDVISWGKILWIARQALFAGAWWPLVFPSIFILITILGINMIADGLNNILNPKVRR